MAHRGKLFHRIQARFRKRRFEIFMALLDEVLAQRQTARILDVGGSPVYWNMLPPEYESRVEIHCLNFAEEFRKYDGARPGIQLQVVVGDGCDMPRYGDDAFDIVHSNSVIEHVGSFRAMERFARETDRVGRNVYVQTPNFWFPIEPHYAVPLIHWLPDAARIWIFTHLSVGYARKVSFDAALTRVDHTRMLSRHMMRNLFPGAEIRSERMALLVKSIIAIRRAPPGR